MAPVRQKQRGNGAGVWDLQGSLRARIHHATPQERASGYRPPLSLTNYKKRRPCVSGECPPPVRRYLFGQYV